MLRWRRIWRSARLGVELNVCLWWPVVALRREWDMPLRQKPKTGRCFYLSGRDCRVDNQMDFKRTIHGRSWCFTKVTGARQASSQAVQSWKVHSLCWEWEKRGTDSQNGWREDFLALGIFWTSESIVNRHGLESDHDSWYHMYLIMCGADMKRRSFSLHGVFLGRYVFLSGNDFGRSVLGDKSGAGEESDSGNKEDCSCWGHKAEEFSQKVADCTGECDSEYAQQGPDANIVDEV